MKQLRVLTAALFAAVLLCGFSATAYAGGGEEFMDGTGGYDPDPPVAEESEPEPNPFTPEGTGTVVDNATDEDGKEFFTITTPNENIFYLVIDRQRSGENVYFLPLDYECYMLGKCWTGALCRYFREAVLPLNPVLEAALTTQGPRPDFKICPVCGGAVAPDRRQAYCSEACALKAHRRQQREYMRKKRGRTVDN